jgi:cell division protease FtsH
MGRRRAAQGPRRDLAKLGPDIAMTMNTRYAMVPELGNMTYDAEQQGLVGPGMPSPRRTYSEQTAREIDCAARAIVDQAFRHAHEILERNRHTLQEAAEALFEKETVTEAELAVLFSSLEKEPPLVSAA